jgi:L-rhamnose mutarotase
MAADVLARHLPRRSWSSSFAEGSILDFGSGGYKPARMFCGSIIARHRGADFVTRYCLTVDLKDDPTLIAEYKRYHEKIWPEITQSIKSAGIDDLEIYLLGTRMFMIIEAGPGFSLEAKAQADKVNPRVQQWEELMRKFQNPLPQAKPGEKWLLMERIFKLEP